MDKIKVFFLEPTDGYACWLRRVGKKSEKGTCPSTGWSHECWVRIEDQSGTTDTKRDDKHPHDDPRWPKECPCGYKFEETDHWWFFTDKFYQRVDNGEKIPLREAPAGAMWYADWMLRDRDLTDMTNRSYVGPDNHCLVVRVPLKHDWMVDGKCSNCTKPEDKIHKCWVRHGDPRTGNVHVDKNGDTCAAGGGSIITSEWHGFLHDGFLVTC